MTKSKKPTLEETLKKYYEKCYINHQFRYLEIKKDLFLIGESSLDGNTMLVVDNGNILTHITLESSLILPKGYGKPQKLFIQKDGDE